MSSYIGEGPGLATRVEFVFTAVATQATFSGNDDNGLFLNYTVGLINVYINGVLQVNGSDYTATDGTSVVFSSGLSASDVVTVGAYGAFSPADTYSKTETDTKLNRKATIVDTRRNLITNPCMQASQENGDTAGTTNNYYVADEWLMKFVSSGAFSGQRIQSTTLAGALDRLRLTVVTPDTTLDAGDYLAWRQNIEGSKLAPAQFGTPEAKDLVVRFMGNFPTGTYCVALANNDGTRSFVREFTAVAGVDTVYEVTFPGDTSGAWPTGNELCAKLWITAAAGSTWQTTPDAWQAGHYFGTSTISNGMATVQSFEIGDVGLKLDPDGIGYGEFEVPDPAENLRACQRYYRKYQKSTDNIWLPMGTYNSSTVFIMPMQWAMRNGPTLAYSALSHFDCEPWDDPPTAIVLNYSTPDGGALFVTTPTRTTAQAAVLTIDTVNGWLALNARM